MKLRCCGTGSSGNCYSLISDMGEILLIECGVDKWSDILKMIDYRISDVSGCILTHCHKDHSKNAKKVMQSGIQIYTNDETVESMNITTGELMIGLPEMRTKEIGSFRVIPFYLPHTTPDGKGWITPCPNYGYVIEHEEMGRMIYASDMQVIAVANGTGWLSSVEGTSYKWNITRKNVDDGIPCGTPRWRNMKSMKLNHFLIECNYMYSEREYIKPENRCHVLQGHHSLMACKAFVSDSKTPSMRTITLCHISDDNGSPDRMQKEIQEVAGKDVLVQIARVGLEVNLNLCPF